MRLFYKSVIESVMLFRCVVWYSGCRQEDLKKLQRNYAGENRHGETHSGIVISFIRDSISYVQRSRVAQILGVGHRSYEHGKLSIQQLFKSYQEALQVQLSNDAARESLYRRLYEEGFNFFSSKLLDEELQESQIGDVLEHMDKAMENNVATRLAEILGVKLDSQSKTSTVEVLKKWQEKIRKKPLEHKERNDLSNKLFKEGYVDFSLEVMTGFVTRPMETTQKKTTATTRKAIKKAATHSDTRHFKTTPGTGAFDLSFGMAQLPV